ncbi:MAG: hypothetical protein AAF415_03615 [Pseudomonadota bacterium]
MSEQTSPETDGLSELEPIELPKRSYFWSIAGFCLFVLAPVVLATWYYFSVAADRYVSEFRYAVRAGTLGSGSDAAGGGSLSDPSALLAAGDSFILEDYIVSARAMVDLAERVPLREMLDRDGDDPVRAYSPDLPPEDLLDFWRSAVSVRFDVITGISVVRVQMYRPEDSKMVADALVDMLRVLVDQLTENAQAEMLTYVASEVRDARLLLDENRNNIELFRRENRMFSPDVTTGQTEELIAELRGQISEITTQLDSLPIDSPRRPVLLDRIRSLDRQIADERSKAGGKSGDGELSEQLNQFERLENEYQISLDSYISALELQRESRATATLSQVQLVVFVPPPEPILPTQPERWWEVLIIALIAFAIWLIGRIFLASLRTP